MLRCVSSFWRRPLRAFHPLIGGSNSSRQTIQLPAKCSAYLGQQYSTTRSKTDFAAEAQQAEADRNPFKGESKMRKILELEMEVLRQEGHRVPEAEFITEEHWVQILSLNSKSARRKYYAFLWQVEKKKENKLAKKEERQKYLEERRAAEKVENENNEHVQYGLTRNTFFLRIYDTTMNLWNNNKLIQAIQFGPKLVFDCSYDVHMTKRESINAAKQLMLSFATNRNHDEPFDLHFCNVNFSGVTMEYFGRHVPTAREPWFPLNLHEDCFTKVFPKERLVYLTPHCREDLMKFNHDDVYIVGCMVDKINNEPLSLAKAKKLGLRMARLPLDRYLQWKSGSGKSLTLNQMTDILLDVKQYDDWRNALKHVPSRKTADISTLPPPRYRNSVTRDTLGKYKFNLETWSSNPRKSKA